MLLAMICLSSCAATNYNYCAKYPIAGEKVEKELKNLPYQGYENFWEWLARINKLRQELENCYE